MKTKRTITIISIITALAIMAAFGIFRQTTPVKAQDQAPPVGERFSFGMVGLTDRQTMRVNVSNIIAASDSNWPPGPTRVAIIVVNSRGQLVRNRSGQVIRRVVQLERGDSTFLDVDFDELTPGPIRGQLRAVVSVIPPPVGDNNALQDGVCIPSVEIINNSTGKTLFMNPAVIRGFNPQPDPPMPE